MDKGSVYTRPTYMHADAWIFLISYKRIVDICYCAYIALHMKSAIAIIFSQAFLE